jgi:GNAT superfamily N-acetyltransferase
MQKIEWCHDAREAQALADFFQQNITTKYISHAELQGPRTTESGEWAPDLGDVFMEEIIECCASPSIGGREAFSRNICILRESGVLVGLAYVSVRRTRRKTFAVLEDIVIDRGRRGSDLGTALVTWVLGELERIGVRRIFLESGLGNESAHHFFEKLGFQQCSIVMVR